MRRQGVGARLGRREDSLAVQSVILTAARVVSLVFTFAIPLVLVRVFSQSDFGVYKQLFLVTATLIPIFDLGLPASVFYFVPRDEGRGQRFVLQAAAVLSLAGAACGIGLVLGGGALAAALDAPAIAQYRHLLALFVVIAVPAVLADTVPVVDRRPTLAALTITGSDLLRACAIITAAVVWRSIEAVVWATILSACVRAAWMITYVRLREGGPGVRIDPRDVAAQLRYALPFAFAGVFEIGLRQFHQYYVAGHAPAARFAVYTVGILHIPVVGMLITSVVDVMLVRAAEADRAGDRVALQRLWRTALERLAVILLPTWVLLQLLAPDIIGLLFGPDYLAAVPVFRVFTTTVLLWGLVDHGILRATGDTPFLIKANVAGMLASIATVIVFAPSSLFLAAISGYVVGIAVARGLGVAMVARRLGLGPAQIAPWRAIARTGAAALLGAAASTAALALAGPLLRLAAGGALFACVYLLLVYRWELVPRQEITALARRFVPAYRWSS